MMNNLNFCNHVNFFFHDSHEWNRYFNEKSTKAGTRVCLYYNLNEPVKAITEKLTPTQKEMFGESCFGKS